MVEVEEAFTGIADKGQNMSNEQDLRMPHALKDVDTVTTDNTSNATYLCEGCFVEVPDYEPEMCCGGFECGCMGQPIEPCWCDDCWKLWYEADS